eukprot:GHVU01060310.1.p1 GENE.GHVU01060310.1~~GHVU01060310.1.p1  ORF type:complete len:350 (-),score=28.99 GHVU01060310.1:312-1217(-)
MATLFYFAGNPFQGVVASMFRISQPAVSRVIAAVTDALVAVRDQFIQWPHGVNRQRRIMMDIFAATGFPGVRGIIDCTHVWITDPRKNIEQYYVNRKGWKSLNVQAVCDHRGAFTHVCAEWPGSTHDSFILRTCDLWEAYETGDLDGIILGDSGYASRPWLMTPYRYPRTRLFVFNDRLVAGRCRIEMAFGKAKRRWSILRTGVRLQHDRVPATIMACFVLQNIVIDHGIRERVARHADGNSQADDLSVAPSDSSDDDDGNSTVGSDAEAEIDPAAATRTNFRSTIRLPELPPTGTVRSSD